MEFTQQHRERFMKVDPATIGHHVKSDAFMNTAMKPLNKAMKVVGPAYTVRLEGRDSSAFHYALSKAPAGSVIVITCSDSKEYACIGEMVALSMKVRGFAGFVIDGPVTDSVAIEKMDFPAFCTGVSVVTTNILGIYGEQNVTIHCAGAIVHPGDIVFGDADGVVVLPKDDFETYLIQAEEALIREVEIRERILSGQVLSSNIEKLYQANVLGMIAELRK